MLYVRIYDKSKPSLCSVLPDVKSLNFTTMSLGGFGDAKIDLSRQPGRSYREIAVNNHLDIITDEGDICWEGRVSGIPQQLGDSPSFGIVGVGYQASLADLSASWLPNYQSFTDIVQIIRDGVTNYATSLVISTATAPNVGRTIQYSPDNAASVRTHLEELLRYGNSANYQLIYQVWNGRKLYVSSKPLNVAPLYETSLAQCAAIDFGVNGDNFYTKVTVKYRDYVEVRTVTAPTSPPTAIQKQYGTTFGSPDPAATVTNFVREPQIIDITNHGIINQAQAQFVADTLLNSYTNNGYGPRATASRMSIKIPNAIKDARNGQTVNFGLCKAGNAILMRDLYDVNSGLTPEQAAMFISQTSVTQNNEDITIELTSETGTSQDLLLAGLLNGITPEPE